MRLKRIRWIAAHVIVNSLAAIDWLDIRARHGLYRRYGLQIGKDAFIAARCQFVYPNLANVKLGERTFLNHGCYLENGHSIEIGTDSCLAPFVRLLTTTHSIASAERRVGYGCDRKPVKVGAGVWIGSGVTVLPGVTIGDGCVIAAGAVVTRNCQANGLYAGVPARRVKELSQ